VRKKRQSRRKKVRFALHEQPSKSKVKKSNLVAIDEDQEIREIVAMKRVSPKK